MCQRTVPVRSTPKSANARARLKHLKKLLAEHQQVIYYEEAQGTLALYGRDPCPLRDQRPRKKVGRLRFGL